MKFTKATKTQSRARIALISPAGGGKTLTALILAQVLAGEKRIAVVDTEHGSASKYADRFDFDVLELASFDPDRYIEAIHAAENAGHGVIVLDSLSHAWMGKDGVLDIVDKAASRSKSENRFNAWREGTPKQIALVETILQSSIHVIATIRSKMDYALEEYTDSEGRKKNKPVKLGLAPVQREGIEYEFDVIGELDIDHVLTITKTRCDALTGQVYKKPGAELGEIIKAWLTDGAPMPYNFAARKKYLVELREKLKKINGVPPTLTAEDGATEQALERQISITLELINDKEGNRNGLPF